MRLKVLNGLVRMLSSLKIIMFMKGKKVTLLAPICLFPITKMNSWIRLIWILLWQKRFFSSSKMPVAISENTSNNTNHTILPDSYLKRLNDEKELIKNHYLYLSGVDSVSKQDELLIGKVLNEVVDVGYISWLMDECYKLRISKTAAAGQGAASIWSFKYFYNYIVKENEIMIKENRQPTFTWEPF